MHPSKKLSEICEILDRLRRPVTASDRIAWPYPYYWATWIQDYVDQYIFDEDLVLVWEDWAKWWKWENTAFKISGKTWVNNHAHVLRLDANQVEKNWIIHFLNHSDLSPYISGATVKKLNQERLRSIEIPLPPLSTQSRIVARLDSAFANIDEQISLLRANIVDMENMRKSVLEESFKRREHKVEKLSEIAKLIMWQSPTSNTYNSEWKWLPFYQWKKEFWNVFPNPQVWCSEPIKIVEKWDVLISVRAPVWPTNLCNETSCIGRWLAGIRPKLELLELWYFRYYFKKYETEISKLWKWSTFASITKSDLETLQIPLPHLPRQQEIVAHLDRVFAETSELKIQYEAQIRDLETLKQSLLEEAFAGRLVIE